MATSDILLKIKTAGAEKASGALNKLGISSQKMGMVMKTVAVAAVLALGKGITEAVKAFTDFDDKMTQSLAIMKTTVREQEAMKLAAMDVARTTRISATDSAEAYFFLASAGLDAEQSIAALPQVAKFAQAGMFDMATATDLATDAQSALGLTVKNAQKNLDNLTRVTDVLVKANTLANASVQQFSEALTTKAGAALKVVNKDIEEGVAVLAAFADRGVKGAEAGDKLNQVLRDIPRATAKNSEEFEKLGLNMFDTEGNMKNVADIVEELDAVLGPMSDEMKAATLDQLGLNRGVADAVKILSGAGDQIREYEKELRNAGGTTGEIADKQMGSLKAQTDLMKNAMEELGIVIGELLAPTLTAIVNKITKVTQATTAVIKKFKDWKDRVSEQNKVMQENIHGVEVARVTYNKYANVTLKDYTSATDRAIESASGLNKENTNYSRTMDIVNQALKDKTKAEEENIESMEDVKDAQEEVVYSFEDGISAIQDAVGAYKKLKDMQDDVADAEKRRDKANKKLSKEQDKRLRIVEDIERAEENLRREQEKSIEVTKEERLAILRQEEAIRKLEEAEDKNEIQELELALAKEKLIELQKQSVGATYDEEQALRQLTSLQEDLVRQDERILEAKNALTEAQEDLNSAMEQTPDKMLEIFLATQLLNDAMLALGGEGGPLMEETMKRISEIMGTDFASKLKASLGSMGVSPTASPVSIPPSPAADTGSGVANLSNAGGTAPVSYRQQNAGNPNAVPRVQVIENKIFLDGVEQQVQRSVFSGISSGRTFLPTGSRLTII